MALDEDTQLKLAEVAVGLDVMTFLRTPVGHYLLERAKAEEASAIEEFRKVDPADVALVREIQYRARMAQNFIDWLEDAVTTGRNAEEQLSDQSNQGDGT